MKRDKELWTPLCASETMSTNKNRIFSSAFQLIRNLNMRMIDRHKCESEKYITPPTMLHIHPFETRIKKGKREEYTNQSIICTNENKHLRADYLLLLLLYFSIPSIYAFQRFLCIFILLFFFKYRTCSENTVNLFGTFEEKAMRGLIIDAT